MTQWDRSQLGEVADLCLGKMLDQAKNRGELLPYLANVNVRWGEIELDNLRTMRFEPHERDRYGLKFGDIVMCEGGEPGRCAIWKEQIPGMMIQKALHRIRPRDALDYQFLFYSLVHIGVTKKFDQYFTGATIKHLPGEKLAKVEIDIPPLPIQRRIAGILSAYDELIENSQRRIKILESMARALYREWFVHFRFPGHESVPLVPSALGEIPEGWEVKSLGEVCARIESGGTPRRSTVEYWEGGVIDWYKTGELWDGFLFAAQEKITSRGQRESTARLFEPGTILMAIYGSPTVGRMGILTTQASCNQAALGLMADKRFISQSYLYFVLYSLRDHFNGIAQGAAQQNISKDKVSSAIVTVPTRQVLHLFDDQAVPILEKIKILEQQVRNLRRTRDLVLPRLLSGQIDVEALPELSTKGQSSYCK
jgi:type I restriction enzyme, S subunit